ncbi:hypothetical protein WMF11_44775 [Sorangium sp. So ce295]|uniref:hypothetical protein n=1 Tax=Sorangium sp. So ce295 TaxID=3133295 RepID=UPI003F5D7D00
MERAFHQAAVAVAGAHGVDDARHDAAALEHLPRLAGLRRAVGPPAREQHPRPAAAAKAPGGAGRPLVEAAVSTLDQRRPREAGGMPGQEQRAHDRPLRVPRIDRVAEIHPIAEARRQRRDRRGDLAAQRVMVRVVEDLPGVRRPDVDRLSARAEHEAGPFHDPAPDVAVPFGPIARAVRDHEQGPRPLASRRHDHRGAEVRDLERDELGLVRGRRRLRRRLGRALQPAPVLLPGGGRIAAADTAERRGERRSRAPLGADRERDPEEERPPGARGAQRVSTFRTCRAHRARRARLTVRACRTGRT